MTEKFSNKKFTQSNYRGSSKSISTEAVILNAELEPLNVKEPHKPSVRKKIHDELKEFLEKLLPEEVAESIIKGSFLVTLFKKLGL